MIDVLILGSGFIGNELAEYLSTKSDVLVTLFSKDQLDYTNTATLYYYFFNSRIGPPDIVINTSGYTGRPNIDAAEDDKENCWFYNVITPRAIYDACINAKVPLIHISSGCIYNGYDLCFSENDQPNFGLYSNDSSFYSKTKHAAETMMPLAHHFRLRMPFSSKSTSRNYFNKIVGYKQLISEMNSMTCLEDFCDAVYQSLEKVRTGIMPSGPYHIVNGNGTFDAPNSSATNAKDVIRRMSEAGAKFKPSDYDFIPLRDLDTKAQRSNCILSNQKLLSYGIKIPDIKTALDKTIPLWVENYKRKS